MSGSHLYAEEGSDNVTVTINDVGGSSDDRDHIDDGCGCAADGGHRDSGRRRRGHDAGDAERDVHRRQSGRHRPADFSGTINWGDGNTTNFTSGDVAANGGGAFTVNGSHLYAEEGPDNVTVTINDKGGSRRPRPHRRRLRMRR